MQNYGLFIKSNYLVNINCPLCDCDKCERLFSSGNKLFPLYISICQNCGFVFQNPRFSEHDWDYYYLMDYDKYHRPLPSKNTKLANPNKNAIDIYNRINKEINLNNIQNILDIGAGKGDILTYFYNVINFKTHLFAIEPSNECKKLLEMIGVKIIGSSLNDFDYRYLDKIDVIIIRHVLEHLYNPLETIKKLQIYMTGNCILYIAVPNLFGFDGRSLDIFGFPHISYFNKITLKILAENAGLSVISIVEENDEVYGIFKKSKGTKTIVIKSDGNYKLTLDYIKKNYQLPIKKNIKRLVSYLIPIFLLRKYFMTKRR